MALIHNPPEEIEATRPDLKSLSCKLSRLRASSALNQTDPEDILAVLNQWDEALSGDAQTVLAEQLASLSEDGQTETACLEFSQSSRLFARELDIAPGQQMLVVNGRVSTFHCKLYMQGEAY